MNKDKRMLFFEPCIFVSPKSFVEPIDPDTLKQVKLPISALYLASYLELNGIESRVVSCHSFLSGRDPRIILYEGSEDQIKKIAYFHKKIIEYSLNTFPTNTVGISLTSGLQEYSAKLIIRIVRKLYKDIKILVGGQHATFDAERLLHDLSPDIIVLGEGEDVLLELFANNYNLKNVKGTAYKLPTGEIISNGMPHPFDLEKKSYPMNYDLILFPPGFRPDEMKYIISASRGCYYLCRFCLASNLYNGKVRFRKIEHIKKDLEHIAKLHRYQRMLITDNVVNSDKSFFQQLCLVFKEFNEKLEYMAFSSVYKINDADLELMRNANIKIIELGLQHTDKDVLKEMKKTHYPVSKLIDIFKKIKDKKLFCEVDAIIGHPKSSFEKDLNLFRNLERMMQMRVIDSVHTFIFTPFPGSFSSNSDSLVIRDRNPSSLTSKVAVHELIDESGNVVYSRKDMNKMLRKFMLLKRSKNIEL